MNLPIDKKQAGSQLPSDKALAAIAGDVYTQLRDQGMNPRDVISIASHLLSNVMSTLRKDQPKSPATKRAPH